MSRAEPIQMSPNDADLGATLTVGFYLRYQITATNHSRVFVTQPPKARDGFFSIHGENLNDRTDRPK